MSLYRSSDGARTKPFSRSMNITNFSTKCYPLLWVVEICIFFRQPAIVSSKSVKYTIFLVLKQTVTGKFSQNRLEKTASIITSNLNKMGRDQLIESIFWTLRNNLRGTEIKICGE